MIINESANNYVFYSAEINGTYYYFVKPRNSIGYSEYVLISNDGKTINKSENITACKFKKVLWKKFINDPSHYDPSQSLKIKILDLQMRNPSHFDSERNISELIEEFSQFFTIKELPNLKSIYNYLKFEMRVPDVLIDYYFDYDISSIENEIENVQIGQSKILFPDNIKEKNKNDIIELVKTAQVFLNNKNVGFLLYGNISIVKLSNRVLGDYNSGTNTIRIDYNAKKSKTALLTIFHELGHRLLHKFFNYNVYDQIRNKYKEVMLDAIKSREQFKTDDLIYLIDKSVNASDKIKNADYFIIEKIKPSRNDIKYDVVAIKDNNQGAYFTIGDALMQKYFSKNPNKEQIKNEESKNTELHFKDSWIPTAYSKTNSSEWFCEMFAAYIGNILTGEKAEWMEDIVLQAPTQ